jgi:hypothetical protein
MENFEQKAMSSSPLKPYLCVRYVDDTNVKWPHGRENLNKFMEHLNSQSKHIQFTMELEDHDSIPFPDVLISRKEDDSLAHQVFRKKTHS